MPFRDRGDPFLLPSLLFSFFFSTLSPPPLLALSWRIPPIRLSEEGIKGKGDEALTFRTAGVNFLREGEFFFLPGSLWGEKIKYLSVTPFGSVTITKEGKIRFPLRHSKEVDVEILSPEPGEWKGGERLTFPFLLIRGGKRSDPSRSQGFRSLILLPASGSGKGDLRAYGNGLELAWEFKGGKEKGILLRLSRGVPERIDRKGNLHLQGEGVRLILPPPRAYLVQEEKEIPARYRIEGKGFWVEAVSPQDKEWTLLIPLPPPDDATESAPKAFTWDTQGRVSLLIDYPIRYGEDTDLLLITLKPGATLPSMVVLLGGSGEDSGSNVSVDPLGNNLFLTGKTTSPDFPTTPKAFSNLCGDDGRCGSSKGTPKSDAFLVQVSPKGELIYSTFWGGSGEDLGSDVAVTKDRIILCGSTNSPDLPGKEKGFHPLCGGGCKVMDGFIALFSGEGRLISSTYLGGREEDHIWSVALDPVGNILVGGTTLSPDFPVTPGALDTTCGSDGSCDGGKGDGFVAKVDSGLKTLLYGSFVGGEKEDAVEEVETLPTRILLTGVTRSPGFPSEGIRQELGIEGWNLFRMAMTPAYLLRVEVEGEGSVASTPSGILCGSQCSSPFPEGTSVELSPVPGRNARFLGWEGDERCKKGRVILYQEMLCKARFEKPPRTLTLLIEGEKGNSLRILPQGITCPPRCTLQLPADILLTLVPEPAHTSQFETWKGDPDCEDGRVLLDEDRRCIAVFRKKSE